MRKVLLSLVAVSTLAVAAPVSAAPAYHHRGTSIERELSNIANRVERAEARRVISRREAASLLRRADQIDRLHDRYARNGLDRREVAALQRQVNDLKLQLRFERRDRDGRRG